MSKCKSALKIFSAETPHKVLTLEKILALYIVAIVQETCHKILTFTKITVLRDFDLPRNVVYRSRTRLISNNILSTTTLWKNWHQVSRNSFGRPVENNEKWLIFMHTFREFIHKLIQKLKHMKHFIRRKRAHDPLLTCREKSFRNHENIFFKNPWGGVYRNFAKKLLYLKHWRGVQLFLKKKCFGFQTIFSCRSIEDHVLVYAV